MRKRFKVADHRFALVMPDTHPLWPLMGAYEPFEDASEGDCIFELTLARELPQVEKTPVYVEAPDEKDQSRIELYRTADGWWFEMAPRRDDPVCCWMTASEDFSCATFCTLPSKGAAVFGLNNCLMLLYAFRTADMGTLEMHSSVVMKDGKGYMFLGKSGTGKSTHSRQWLESLPDVELLNDDNPIIRVCDDGVVRVYGSPWSGKTPCYKAKDVPVGAVVRIRQHPENKIRRYGIVEAYASIYSSCSGFKSDKRIADGLHSTLEKVVLSVPCYVLDCRPDHEAAAVCYEEVK